MKTIRKGVPIKCIEKKDKTHPHIQYDDRYLVMITIFLENAVGMLKGEPMNQLIIRQSLNLKAADSR